MRCKSCDRPIDYEVKNTLTGHRHNNTGQYEELCRSCLGISKQAAYSNYNDTIDTDSSLDSLSGYQDTEAVYQGFSDTGWTGQN